MANLQDIDWNWCFTTPETTRELGARPQTMLSQAREIKRNPVRKVFTIPGYYIKYDSRSGKHLKGEWKHAELLKQRGVPCIDYLAYGSGKEGELLISRELADSCTVSEYLWRLRLESPGQLAAFAEKFAVFIKQLSTANITHADFHPGNVLYVPSKDYLALVDVCEVRHAYFFDRWWRRWCLEIGLLAFQKDFDNKFLYHLYALAGSRNPEKSYASCLRHVFKHIRHSWPKRRRQILQGHHRYSLVDGDILRTVNYREKPYDCEGAEILRYSAEEAQRQYLAHAFLAFLGIPHRLIIAWNRKTHELMARPQHVDAVKDISSDMQFRLACFNLSFIPDEWRIDSDGKLFLYDFKQIIALINHLN